MAEFVFPKLEFKHFINIPPADPYITVGSVSHRRSFPAITVLGSNRDIDRINTVEAMLIHAGWNVFCYGGMPPIEKGIYYENPEKMLTAQDHMDMINELWRERIRMSRAVYVVNVDDRIGATTRANIEYAMECGCEVFYMQHHRE